MYSVPYSQDLYSNWLGVGIHGPERLADGLFNKMYYGDEEVWFRRMEYYYETKELYFASLDFVVNATMSTSHRPTVKVNFNRNISPVTQGF